MLALPDLRICLRSSVVTSIVTNPRKSVEVPLLLLSVYDTGSSSYYMLHCAGARVLTVLLMHSYVSVRISFGYGCKMCIILLYSCCILVAINVINTSPSKNASC